jgi:acyl-coenzyme A thioesterase PaaI-like protein
MTRLALNFFPAFRGSGGRLTYVESDWSRVKVKLPLSWRTRNYVGTIYGGSMYGAVDPVYMVMLIRMLGRDYIVWDKAAHIQFLKPGKTTLYADFEISQEELEEIKTAAREVGKIEREFIVHLKDKDGVIHATCTKLLSIRIRDRSK